MMRRLWIAVAVLVGAASPALADTTAPVLGKLAPVTAHVGNLVTLSAANLNATDPDDTPDQIRYAVVIASDGSKGTFYRGTVALPWNVAKFTQADVNAGIVVYEPPTNLGNITAPFTASDPAGNSVSGTLAITVMMPAATTLKFLPDGSVKWTQP